MHVSNLITNRFLPVILVSAVFTGCSMPTASESAPDTTILQEKGGQEEFGPCAFTAVGEQVGTAEITRVLIVERPIVEWHHAVLDQIQVLVVDLFPTVGEDRLDRADEAQPRQLPIVGKDEAEHGRGFEVGIDEIDFLTSAAADVRRLIERVGIERDRARRLNVGESDCVARVQVRDPDVGYAAGEDSDPTA